MLRVYDGGCLWCSYVNEFTTCVRDIHQSCVWRHFAPQGDKQGKNRYPDGRNVGGLMVWQHIIYYDTPDGVYRRSSVYRHEANVCWTAHDGSCLGWASGTRSRKNCWDKLHQWLEVWELTPKGVFILFLWIYHGMLHAGCGIIWEPRWTEVPLQPKRRRRRGWWRQSGGCAYAPPWRRDLP